jgi:3-oxoacyl-[acyl-carrier protein] reductase
MGRRAVADRDDILRADAFRGAVVLVTGAASGVGRATALAFAGHGAHVVVADVATEPAEAVAIDARAGGGSAEVRGVDVSRPSEVAALFEAVDRAHGRLDGLVCNAAVLGKQLSPDDIDEAEWDRVMAINLKGVFLCAQAAARIMKRQRRGRIVMVGSSAGKQGGPTSPVPYCVTKAGVMGLAKALARHYAPFGITVNAVAPGLVTTPLAEAFTPAQRAAVVAQTPLARECYPEEIAAAIVFLASPAASYVTGEVLDVNGGLLMD